MIKIHFLGLPGAGKSTVASALFSHLKQNLPLCVIHHHESVTLALAQGELTKEELEKQETQAELYTASIERIKNVSCDILVTEDSPLVHRFYNLYVPENMLWEGDPSKQILVVVSKNHNTYHVDKGRAHNAKQCLEMEERFNAYIDKLSKQFRVIKGAKTELVHMLADITREIVAKYLGE